MDGENKKLVEEKVIPEVKNISQKSPNDDFLGGF